MKTILTVLGIVLLVGVFAYPAFSNSHGWGRGHHMPGFWDRDHRYGYMHDRGYGDLSDEAAVEMEELDRKYARETEEIRDQIVNKSAELDALLDSPKPDLEGVRALQREISDLQGELDQKALAYELEVRKIAPDQRFGRGYGRGYHGGHWARGGGMGYGPGACWR